jgi:predicted amidohydrolase YtcJ
VKNGRIAAAGAASSPPIPKDAKRIDVHHKTIIPGLCDMLAHLHQAELAPVYLATGVTTVRPRQNSPASVNRSMSAIPPPRGTWPSNMYAKVRRISAAVSGSA